MIEEILKMLKNNNQMYTDEEYNVFKNGVERLSELDLKPDHIKELLVILTDDTWNTGVMNSVKYEIFQVMNSNEAYHKFIDAFIEVEKEGRDEWLTEIIINAMELKDFKLYFQKNAKMLDRNKQEILKERLSEYQEDIEEYNDLEFKKWFNEILNSIA